MVTRHLADGSLQTYGNIDSVDFYYIVQFYNNWFTVQYPIPDGIITISEWLGLINAIKSGAGTLWSISLPSVSYGFMGSTIWPKPNINFNSYEQEFARAGTFSVTVPLGCGSVYVEYLVGAGGAGGDGTEKGNGGGGGGGSSGAWVTNYTIPVKSGQSLTIVIPDNSYPNGNVVYGGGASFQAGSATISINNSVVVSAQGGWSGMGGEQYNSPSTGGQAVTPNGNPGTNGEAGTNDYSSCYGGNGGDGPFGGGGAGGKAFNVTPGNGSNYGAGGGGSGTYDRHVYNFPGGYGFRGYAKIRFDPIVT
mgnify:CR=1 FL=1